jgi:hypothetical protein
MRGREGVGIMWNGMRNQALTINMRRMGTPLDARLTYPEAIRVHEWNIEINAGGVSPFANMIKRIEPVHCGYHLWVRAGGYLRRGPTVAPPRYQGNQMVAM